MMFPIARNGCCKNARISDCSTVLPVLLRLLRARVSLITGGIPTHEGNRFAGTSTPDVAYPLESREEVRDNGDRKALAKNWLTRRVPIRD